MNMPVESSFPELLDALTSHDRVLLTAPPGSGKTTRVPLFLMEHMEGTILMLEPRRLAARSAARYMAASLGEQAGQRVGYRVRLESRVSRDTRVEIITEGILTRRLISDPELSGVSCVVFDEFHERSLQADTGLALCLEAQQALRPDLKILVMSATLDSDSISSFLAPCPVVKAEGSSYPVELRYAPCPAAGGIGTFEGRQALLAHCAATVHRALSEESGSALVFLPGQAEIRKVAELLENRLPSGTSLHPLYGDLSAAEQDAAIAPAEPGFRKVVLATSIAETSLTIEGVRIVVDSGLSRTARFSPATGMSSLVTERVTQDAADQRAGRAGRIEPGTCWRLWHEGDTLLPCRRPEIMEADLAPFLLEVLAWGSLPDELPFLTPPPASSVAQALQTLRLLDAVREKNGRPQLTPHGKNLARLPLHPRLASMVLSAGEHTPLAAVLAALVEERSVGNGCDLRPRLGELRRNARLCRAAEQIYSFAEKERLPLQEALRDEDFAGPLLSLAWPERIAQKRERGSFRLASGRGAVLPPEDPLADADFLAVAAMDGGSSGTGRIYLAAPLDRTDIKTLHAERLRHEDSVLWDERSESVLARRRLMLDALILEDAPLRGADLSAESVMLAAMEGISRLGLNCLPWTEELRQWQARVMLMRRMEGEDSEWPDVSDEALLTALKEEGADCWLAPWLAGVNRRTQFPHIDLGKALRSLLPYASARRLDREVPTHLSVPSGSEVRIDYLPEGGPVLAVKLQEMFGQQESPAVCGGRCAVVVHLLSPAGRPLQVTRDLAGFWRTGYAAVRAEMRGRYPKHPWPEDPLTALATKKTNKALARS
ncbi:MAG: ATP-dependent helicase HrpB [Mailhella sp.]|nr:ATP-dependent helicase HrpB [Mailhella sp.]